MCQFFSFCTKGSQKFYFDWKQRQELLKNNPEDYDIDSHTSICHFHKVDEDKVNKYEFNPLTKEFKVDQINIKDDQIIAKRWVKKLDFKTIVETLIIKEIVNPLMLEAPEFNDDHKEMLRQWDSVGASVGASVGDSVWAYISSFFTLDKVNPFQSGIDLWELGFVPSFDGKIWRIHAGEKAEVVFEISHEDLTKK